MRVVGFGACLVLIASGVQADVTGRHRPGKGFSFETDDGANSIAVYGQLQARYTFVEADDDRAVDDLSDLRVRRARVYFGGRLFTDCKYEVQTAFENGEGELKDAILTYARFPAVNISVGQLQPALDWQQKTSSSRQTFVDRSLAADEYGSDRDLGVQLHGKAASGGLEYAVGFWDRAVDEELRRDDGAKYTARLSLQPNGPFGYSEGDLERTDRHLWVLNVSFRHDEDILGRDDFEVAGVTHDDVPTHSDVTTYNAGFGYRHGGVYVQGEYFRRHFERVASLSKVSALENDESDVDSNAWYFQVGYVFPGSTWAMAVRYSKLDPDEEVDDDRRSEPMLGVNRFFEGVGHPLKVSGDVALVEDEELSAKPDDDLRLRLQLQLLF